MKKRYLIPIIVFLLFLCLIALLNKKVTTKHGVDYKPTRYEGKGFLRNLNIRMHRDVAGLPDGLLGG